MIEDPRAVAARKPKEEEERRRQEEQLVGLRPRLGLDHNLYGEVRRMVNDLLDVARKCDAPAREQLADWLEQGLDGLEDGWRHPDLKAKKRKKWEDKTRHAIAKLRTQA